MGSDSEKKRKRKNKKDGKEKRKHKKSKHNKKHKKRKSSSSDSVSDECWIEKPSLVKTNSETLERDDWMSMKTIATFSKEKEQKEVDKKTSVEQYDPRKSSRELNPHWKCGDGTGLPMFNKPSDDDYYSPQDTKKYISSSGKQDGWKKIKADAHTSSRTENNRDMDTVSKTKQNDDIKSFSSDDLNKLSAKVMKAELMGDFQLAEELKEKLDKAKELRMYKDTSNELNNQTDVQFTTRRHNEKEKHYKKSKNQVQLDHSVDISSKFCLERNDNENLDAQFYKISSKLDKHGDNLANIFDHGKASTSFGASYEEKTVSKMNSEQRAQQDCDKCISSNKFHSDYIISLGKKSYLAIPRQKGLTSMHCIIVPMVHCPGLTFLDEDVFSEVVEFCKCLSRMFNDNKMDFVFFETVRYLNRQPHTFIECVPAKDKNFEMIAFYFKKAILESETEWAMNKKLHNVNGMEVRKVVPKGLPYFWINFNFEKGFAHVIEDQEIFKSTFAHETIAGMLNLDANSWRKPGKEYNPSIKVNDFKRLWNKYDFTEK